MVGAVFFDWHSVGDSAAVLRVVLRESLLVPLPLARGKKRSQLQWLLGTVWSSCLLVPPPWSVGKPSQLLAVEVYRCSVGIVKWTDDEYSNVLELGFDNCCVLAVLVMQTSLNFGYTVHNINLEMFILYISSSYLLWWSWNNWNLCSGASSVLNMVLKWLILCTGATCSSDGVL